MRQPQVRRQIRVDPELETPHDRRHMVDRIGAWLATDVADVAGGEDAAVPALPRFPDYAPMIGHEPQRFFSDGYLRTTLRRTVR